MRIILTASIAVLAAATINTTSSKAQFNARFCTYGGGFNSSGAPDCAFHTWEQCIATARGLGRYCAENPRWQGDRSRGSQRRVRRERDDR